MPIFSSLYKQKNKKKIKLTHSQISEFISDYTSSSKGSVTLQYLIMNSLMKHQCDLFVNKNDHEQCNSFRFRFRSRHWYSHEFKYSL